MDCSLVLTTLLGVTIKISLSVAKFDRFEDLEDQVMDYLVSVTDPKVFGCSIDFLQIATQTYVHVPMNLEEIVPEGAFAGVPRMRHVSVESGISGSLRQRRGKIVGSSHCQIAGHCGPHFRQCLSRLQTTKQCLGSWLRGIWNSSGIVSFKGASTC